MYSKCLEDLVNAITIWIPGRRFAGTCNGNTWTTITTLHKNAASKFQKFFSGCEKMQAFTTQAKTFSISMSITDLNVYMPLRRHVSFLPNPQCILPKHHRFVPMLHNHSCIKHHPTFHLRPAPQNSHVVIQQSIDVFSKLHNLPVCISSRVHGGLKAETRVAGLDLATANRAQRDKR
jgi:hypothetical protein